VPITLTDDLALHHGTLTQRPGITTTLETTEDPFVTTTLREEIKSHKADDQKRREHIEDFLHRGHHSRTSLSTALEPSKLFQDHQTDLNIQYHSSMDVTTPRGQLKWQKKNPHFSHINAASETGNPNKGMPGLHGIISKERKPAITK
jgi:hypothetical protein